VAAFVLAVFTLMSASAHARLAGEIAEWGETSGERSDLAPSDLGTGLLPAQTMTNIVYVRRTDEIPAQLCRHFGATVQVTGDADDVIPERILVRVHHPLMTAPGGATSTVDEFHTFLNDGRSYAGFTFERKWEMQPGAWTIEFLVGGHVLAAKTFTVALPPAGYPDTICPGAPVS
jgi:hypothetical protein